MAVSIITGDCRDALKRLDDCTIDLVCTSPPYYGLRDYGVDGQIGKENSPDAFINALADIFDEIKRVLMPTGSLYLNLGDSYAGSGKGRNADGTSDIDPRSKQASHKGNSIGIIDKTQTDLPPKSLLGIPWRVAFEMQARGWILREDIIWAKPNPMPEPVLDRCTRAHEYIFHFTKQSKYYYNADAIKTPPREPMNAESITLPIDAPPHSAPTQYAKQPDRYKKRGNENTGLKGKWDNLSKKQQQSAPSNKRSIWEMATKPFKGEHFATFPPELPELAIKAACPHGGMVLDPFAGAGTTGLVADRLGRNAILIELNPAYADIARDRLHGDAPLLAK